MDAKNLDREIHDIVRQIPSGRVITYGEIARLAGFPTLARRVGKALSGAPRDLPCHRVVGSSGRMVPGWADQRKLLEREGVVFRTNGCVDMARFRWTNELFADQSR